MRRDAVIGLPAGHAVRRPCLRAVVVPCIQLHLIGGRAGSALRIDDKKHIAPQQRAAHAERCQEELPRGRVLRRHQHIAEQTQLEVLVQLFAESLRRVRACVDRLARRRARRSCRRLADFFSRAVGKPEHHRREGLRHRPALREQGKRMLLSRFRRRHVELSVSEKNRSRDPAIDGAVEEEASICKVKRPTLALKRQVFHLYAVA